MDTKEEMIDDINEVEDITPDKKIEDVVENLSNDPKQGVSFTPKPVIEPNVRPEQQAPVIQNVNNVMDKATNDIDNNQATMTMNMTESKPDTEIKEETKNEDASQEEQLDVKPKKKKAPIIILLSILLVLDVAALVIYIIGIDKVLSFIK